MRKETKIQIVKVTVGLVAGICVIAVTSAAVKKLIPLDELPKVNKVMISIGAGILGSMAADAASNYAQDYAQSFFDGMDAISKVIEGQFSAK